MVIDNLIVNDVRFFFFGEIFCLVKGFFFCVVFFLCYVVWFFILGSL